MSRDIWISSDLHLFHENVLKFKDRDDKPIRPEFENVEQMNEFILEQHNSRIKPGDIWYNLGDVVMGRPEDFPKLWARFHGRKRLIVGNHDDIKWLASGGFFQKITMWRIFKEHGVIFSHVPLHESSLRAEQNNGVPMLNVHGHIHEKNPPKGPYVNVSVEKTNYAPIHIDDLKNLWNKQQEN